MKLRVSIIDQALGWISEFFLAHFLLLYVIRTCNFLVINFYAEYLWSKIMRNWNNGNLVHEEDNANADSISQIEINVESSVKNFSFHSVGDMVETFFVDQSERVTRFVHGPNHISFRFSNTFHFLFFLCFWGNLDR